MRKGLRPLRVYPRFFYLFNTATEFNDTYINDSVICMRTHSEKVMSTSASHLSAPIHSFRNFKKPSSLFKFPSKQCTIRNELNLSIFDVRDSARSPFSVYRDG